MDHNHNSHEIVFNMGNLLKKIKVPLIDKNDQKIFKKVENVVEIVKTSTKMCKNSLM